MKHEELAFIPMCIPEKGAPWFFAAGVRYMQRDARKDFEKHCCVEWKVLRKEGWRIVRVRLEAHQ